MRYPSDYDGYRRRTHALAWCGAIALALGLCWPALAPAAARADISAQEHIERHLDSENLRNVGTYQVVVANGMVTLTGEVPTLNTVQRIEQQVRKAEPALDIDNRLTVTPSIATDAELAGQVRKAIVTYAFFDVFDWVSGTVENGAVHLTGEVREPWRRDDYAYRVADIPGIQSIDNTIRGLPLSPYDDEIRISAARAIYRDPNFLKYAYRANPPIHIIVDNGTVRLEGTVLNSLERQLAESDVRNGVLSFEVTNNLKTEL